MSEKELRIRNEERQKIGRQLHDTIANDLMALQFYLGKIQNDPKSESIKDAIDRLDYIRRQIRSLSHLYNTETLTITDQKADLKAELKDLLIESAHLYDDLGFNFHAYPKKSPLLINKDICKEILMIIKEAILNAVKHGEAESIEVSLTCHPDELSLMLTDDGIGFDMKKKPSGIGLKNMRERIGILGGSCDIDSRPNYGTTISFQIPNKEHYEVTDR